MTLAAALAPSYTAAHRQVAETILQQLGGNRFLAMTGAKYLVAGPNFLQFTLPANLTADRINSVVVRLDANDTYTVLCNRRRGVNITPKASRTFVFAGELAGVFSELTGLAVAL